MFATTILDLIDFSESEISLVKEKMLALPAEIFEHDAIDSDSKNITKMQFRTKQFSPGNLLTKNQIKSLPFTI